MASSIASDPVSALPDDILHRIILYPLTLKQRAIASLVSKSWRRMIASFNDCNFAQTHSTNSYCAFCYRYFSLVCCEICFGLHPVFKLTADDSFIEFYLFVPRTHASFNLSPAILESRLLTFLHLKGYIFEEKNFEELPSLKEIYFDYVSISPTNLSKFISGCPSIVELILKDCYNDKYCLSPISLSDMNELKKVHVSGTDIESIEIKTRNMLEFHLFSLTSALKLDLRACSKLQALKIDCEYIPIGFPKEISSAFPRLNSLFLRLCKRLNKIKLLSPELENLNLSDMVDLDDAIIVTPNLRSLLQLRNFAKNLGENLTFSLTTNATESKERVIKKGNYPLPASTPPLADPEDIDSYSNEQLEVVQVKNKARNLLHNAISGEEYEKILSCDTAKEMWDKLEVTYDGTSKVKETHINMLVHDYELFSMKE
ncbi:uncharacterized protein LOC142174338 [Nicotiana tabacum]|uniref:Uncharacterized protein LOC142174338 n=1 Tax=Nicotiana tabacum TaxID=4097 RepID=A0AC58TG58_TOBAC